jgi:hypothetical protein
MKHRIVVFTLVVLLAACGDKDPAPTSKLVGKWSALSSETVMTVGGKSYQQYLIDFFGMDAEEATELADLMSGLLTLTGYFAEMEIKADGTWTGKSDLVPLVSGKWELTSDEKTLSLTNNAQPGVVKTATITKLTDTELWFETVDIDLPPGTPLGFEYKVIVKMKRI